MTPEQWIEKQKKVLAEIASGKILAEASIETHRQMANRIFNKGEAQTGSIGRYNTTKPLYVNPKRSPKGFPVKGKYGNTVHKNGTPYKTGYFSSYQEYRNKIGRPTNVVNLNLSGMWQNDFVTGLKKVNNGSYVSVLKRKDNQNKKAGAEKHFGKTIFALTKKERNLFVKLINDQINEINAK